MTRCRLIVAVRIICGKKLRLGDEVDIPEPEAVKFLVAQKVVERLDVKKPDKTARDPGGPTV